MYQKVKHFVFTLIYILLWLRFFAAICDPVFGGLSPDEGMAVYQSWRPAIDMLYTVSYYVYWPIYTLWDGILKNFVPQSPWFPGIFTATLLQGAEGLAASNAQVKAALEQPGIQKAFIGYIDFLVLISMVFYRLINPLIDVIYEFLKNLIWNVLIEFSFTKRKEKTYQEALEKRAADLMKLNVEYKNLSKEASMLAASVITDELTKVYNKRFFLNKMAFEFQTAKDKKGRLAIAMVDIDHFKKLNDNYGHLLGDKVLQAVAHVAKQNTPADCFCCRFGGEEFSIIMPGKTQEQAVEIISAIHRSLPLLRFEEDANLRTAASFGICIADFKTPDAQALNTFEDFIKLADDELYRAKMNGRNRYEIKLLE